MTGERTSPVITVLRRLLDNQYDFSRGTAGFAQGVGLGGVRERHLHADIGVSPIAYRRTFRGVS